MAVKYISLVVTAAKITKGIGFGFNDSIWMLSWDRRLSLKRYDINDSRRVWNETRRR